MIILPPLYAFRELNRVHVGIGNVGRCLVEAQRWLARTVERLWV